jgi:argininosuccinate synthase
VTDACYSQSPLSINRPSREQVAIAQQEGCKFVAHGSTGKGNDQVGAA